MQKEHQISGREYLRLLENRDPERKTIKKKRHCFLYEGKYFELDEFEDGKLLLEVELDDENEEFELPASLKVAKEVTDDLDFSNYVMAKIN